MNIDQFDILPNIVEKITNKNKPVLVDISYVNESFHSKIVQTSTNTCDTRVIVVGDLYTNEKINTDEYVKWFGKQFTFHFSNVIKKIRIHYKNINHDRSIKVNDYVFKNLEKSGFFEQTFEKNTTEVCFVSTIHNFQENIKRDTRDLGILISFIEYTDTNDQHYYYPINEIGSIKSTLVKFLGYKNASNNTYYHCGDFGDIIYALPVIKHTGGGILYLGNDLRIEDNRCKPRDMIDESKCEFLKTLLESQSYIKEVRFTDKYPEGVTYDLNKFRKFFVKQKSEYNDFPNGSNISLLDSPLLTFNIDLSVRDTKWLYVQNKKIINKKIVINRTQRVRNVFGESDDAYKYIVSTFKNESVFVGTDIEYYDFVNKFGHINRYIVESANELAQLIDQSYFFIGNSSFAFAISESLKKNSYFEIRDNFFRHTKFNRDGHHQLNMCNVKHISIPNIYHVVSLYEIKDQDALNRTNIAKQSWDELYKINDNIIPVHVYENEYPRNTESFGDKRKCAFLKDMLRIAYNKCESDDDIIMITNDDTILSPFIGAKIHDKILRYQACKSFRLNIKKYDRFDNIDTYDMLGRDGGRDMFAMTKRWLKQNIELIPDYALGACDWDFFLALLIQFTNGISLSSQKNDDVCETDVEIGHVLHIHHAPPWKLLKSVNYHNHQLTKNGIQTLGFTDAFHTNYDIYKQ